MAASSKFSLLLVVGGYAAGTALGGLLAVEASRRVGTAIMAQLSTTPTPQRPHVERVTPGVAGLTPIPRREASMTPLYDRWSGQSRPPSFAAGPQFGGSSRNPSRWSGPWGFRSSDDDYDEPRAFGAYRTLCVRLCDGYYFPVSFAASQEHLARDRAVCESRCGAQGRLFVHPNPGGSVEDMQDLQGRPYRQLKTAFLYRTEYVPSCACQPQPWDAASLERHRAYALAEAARRGSKEARQELAALQAKARQRAADAAATSPPGERDRATLMRLGGEDGQKPRVEPRSTYIAPTGGGEADWATRAFKPGGG
jgi:hypothetical protein